MDRCSAITRAGSPCANPSVPGKSVCLIHDTEGQAERGRAGGKARAANERAKREALAQAAALETVEKIRDTLVVITKAAIEDGDWSAATSACRCALDCIKNDFSVQAAELRQLVEQFIGQRGQRVPK